MMQNLPQNSGEKVDFDPGKRMGGRGRDGAILHAS